MIVPFVRSNVAGQHCGPNNQHAVYAVTNLCILYLQSCAREEKSCKKFHEILRSVCTEIICSHHAPLSDYVLHVNHDFLGRKPLQLGNMKGS